MTELSPLARHLIDECQKNKSKSLDLGMCGLTHWPLEVCELHWLEELNFCNYSRQEAEEGDYSNFGYSQNIQHNEAYRGKYTLIRNHITQLPEQSVLKKLTKLKKLSIGGAWNTITDTLEYWGLVDITSLEILVKLTELRLSYTKISDFAPLTAIKDLQLLDLSETPVSDITPLAEFKGLQSLKLVATRVAKCASLTGLKGLKSLDLSVTKVTNIAPLAELKGLELLNLAVTLITDCAPLAELKSLKSLDLSETQIYSTSPLNRLKDLQSLNLGHTEIADFSPIMGLKDLKSLNLASTQIIDSAPLAELKGLQSLDLGFTKIANFTPLAGLKHLHSLDLGSTQISDLAPLAELKGLQSLDLGATNISDLAPLARLKGLKSLKLGATKIVDSAPLTKLKGLKSLDLRSTQIVNIAPLAELKGLQSLDLGYTQIANLAPLARLKGLKSLKIVNTKIEDLAPLAELDGLEDLNLWGAKIVDSAPLTKLKGLKSLNLGNTKITDVTPLMGHKNLQWLNLTNAQIADSTALTGLRGIQWLNLGGTRIVNIAPLAKLMSLQSFNLSNTKITNLLPLKELLRQPHMRVVWEDDFEGGLVLEGTNIPKSTVEQGIEALLDDMETHHDIGSKYITNKEVKLIVLGNSTAGKTSLLTYLKTEAKQRKSIKWETIYTTHGLQTAEWIPDFPIEREKETLRGIKVRILDFGGQEYYHDCHHLFFTHNTAYAVLWEKETNQNQPRFTLQKYSNEKTEDEYIEHYDIAYWLDAIRFFTLRQRHTLVALTSYGIKLYDLVKANWKEEYRFRPNQPYQTTVDLATEVLKRTAKKGIHKRHIFDILNDHLLENESVEELTELIWKQEKVFSYSGLSTLVVQNKIGEAHQEAFLDQESLVEQFPFITDFAKVDVRKGIAMEHLEAFHFKSLLEEMPILGETYLDFYLEIDEALELQAEVEKEAHNTGKPLFIDQKTFDKTFKAIVSPKFKEHVPEEERPEKLAAWGQNYLQNRFDTGKLLWYPESENERLKQLIITRPYDMINRFYAILNRDLDEQKSPGRFTLEEACTQVRKAHYPASKRTTKTIQEETQVMLELMQQFHIVFHMQVADKSFYVAPQYLPVSAHKSKYFLDPIFNKGTHRYHYKGFFHKSVTLAFFSEYGKHAASAHETPVSENDFMIWRNGLLVKKDGHMVMVEFNPREHCTLLKPQDGDPQNPLLQEMKAHFEKIHTGRHVDLEVSLDGRHFVSLAALEAKAEANPPVLFHETEGRLHKVAEYSHFFSPETQKKFMRKKLFISYSSKDREMIEEFKSQLGVMKRNGEVESWDDHQILPGAKWDEEIEKQMRAADIIVLMISSDFINSDYIWHKEVPLAFDMEKEGKRVVPIILRHCDWTSLNSPIKDNNSVAKGRPIKSYPDRDEGWLHVVRGLRSVINGGGVNDNFKASE